LPSQLNTSPKKAKTERCSHCKREEHNQERCWVLHPHLKSKRTDQNQAEVAKKSFFTKILEERKRFVVTREPSEEERKGSSEMVSTSSSQNDFVRPFFARAAPLLGGDGMRKKDTEIPPKRAFV
jgi:hypothetical protein